jgi:hypothetical protein
MPLTGKLLHRWWHCLTLQINVNRPDESIFLLRRLGKRRIAVYPKASVSFHELPKIYPVGQV